MMTAITALILLCMPLVALAGLKCGGSGGKMYPFFYDKVLRRQVTDPKVPCRYQAVLQTCGQYSVAVIPGNVYLSPTFHVETLWVSISDDQKTWVGQMNNTDAIKYFNGGINYLFTKSSGTYDTAQILTIGKGKDRVWAQAKDGSFLITFKPWTPHNKYYKDSVWDFDCFRATAFVPNQYPLQLCGNRTTEENKERKLQYGFKQAYQLVTYDILTNTELTQTNPKCTEATRLLTSVCNSTQSHKAIVTCNDILFSNKHRKCIDKYSCDPMDIFLECVRFVCGNYKDMTNCETVSRATHMCRKLWRGNLTKIMQGSGCYQEYPPVNAY